MSMINVVHMLMLDLQQLFELINYVY